MSTENGASSEDRTSKLKLGSHINFSTDKVKQYSEAEVKKHTTEKDCWMIIHGIVYDVGSFLEDHPGGPEIMLQNAGTDATNEFEQVFHSAQARGQLADYVVGLQEGYTGPLDAATSTSSQPGAGTDSKLQTSSGTNPVIYLIPVLVIGAALAYQFIL